MNAVVEDGTLAQVKATQKKSESFRSGPQHLIVLLIHRNDTEEEIYNGTGDKPWQNAGKTQKKRSPTIICF